MRRLCSNLIYSSKYVLRVEKNDEISQDRKFCFRRLEPIHSEYKSFAWQGPLLLNSARITEERF